MGIAVGLPGSLAIGRSRALSDKSDKSDESDESDESGNRRLVAPRRGAFFIAQVSEGRSPDDPGLPIASPSPLDPDRGRSK